MQSQPTVRRHHKPHLKPLCAALSVTYRSLDLKPDPKNPRRHSDRQIEQIARSMAEFGFNVPTLVGADGVILAGHGRAMAAERMGLREVPTISVEHLTASQQRAFAIADNALATKSEWDMTLLGEQFALLLAEDLSFDITVTGLDVAEIDLAVRNLDAPSVGPDPNDVPRCSRR